MPWKEISTEKLAKQLGVNYAEIKARQDLIRKIKTGREKAKLTQEDLAKMVGKSQSWIAKVESGLGTKNVSFDVLFQLLSALGYDFKITTRKAA